MLRLQGAKNNARGGGKKVYEGKVVEAGVANAAVARVAAAAAGHVSSRDCFAVEQWRGGGLLQLR